jgi:hypothetical protein
MALLILSASLAACGGGGGSSTSNAAVPPSGNNTPTTPTVPAANAAPTISGSPATAATVGQAYSFTPRASDPEGARLTFTITGQPSWATFNGATGTLSGTAVAGTFANISISVSDGTNVVALPAFSIAVSGGSATTSGSATLSWTPPTTNDDGSTLANLAGYRIYYGTDQNNLTSIVSLTNPGLSAYTIDGLSGGTYYFTVTAVDASGNESSFSNMASKTI